MDNMTIETLLQYKLTKELYLKFDKAAKEFFSSVDDFKKTHNKDNILDSYMLEKAQYCGLLSIRDELQEQLKTWEDKEGN